MKLVITLHTLSNFTFIGVGFKNIELDSTSIKTVMFIHLQL